MNHELLLRLHESQLAGASRGKQIAQVGPFRSLLSSDPNPAFNYAMPTAAIVRDSDVAALIAHFRSHDRIPRLEFIDDIWPGVGSALEAGGFVPGPSIAVMICTPKTFAPRDGPPATLLAPDNLAVFVHIGNGAYPSDQPIGLDWCDRNRAAVEDGSLRAATAHVDGKPAATGLLVHAEGAAELAAVGTLPEYRRQGLATAVATVLLRDYFSRGGDLAWLQAENEPEANLYSRLGFKHVGHHRHYTAPR